VLAPVLFLGRIALGVLFFPIGTWRSLGHNRDEAERGAARTLERMMAGRRVEILAQSHCPRCGALPGVPCDAALHA
jgi:hypothetical protein